MAIVFLGAFVAWTAVASTWSPSSQLGLEELSRVTLYPGTLVVALVAHRHGAHLVRHTVAAAAVAITLVAVLALASRLHPNLFPGAGQTAAFLPGTRGRLSWPLNYWNALAAFFALGIPLLLAIATSAHSRFARAAAAGAVPILVLAGYFTFSRGGLLAAGSFELLWPAREPYFSPAVNVHSLYLETASDEGLVGLVGSSTMRVGSVRSG